MSLSEFDFSDVAETSILVFDSGLGGLSVLSEIIRRQPTAHIVYVADDAAFPYGSWENAALIDHIVRLMGELLARFAPDVVVIACNTASTIVLNQLRSRYKVPFVGTVPAIKPAAEATKSGLISVLATPGTVARDYTRQLVQSFAANCQVTLVGSSMLATLAEADLRGEISADADILREIMPCFVDDAGRRTDVVVLGCTHYPLLLDRFRRLAPWEVVWLDGAPAIARRMSEVLRPLADSPPGEPIVLQRPDLPARGRGEVVFTSGAPLSLPLRRTLERFGLIPARI